MINREPVLYPPQTLRVLLLNGSQTFTQILVTTKEKEREMFYLISSAQVRWRVVNLVQCLWSKSCSIFSIRCIAVLYIDSYCWAVKVFFLSYLTKSHESMQHLVYIRWAIISSLLRIPTYNSCSQSYNFGRDVVLPIRQKLARNLFVDIDRKLLDCGMGEIDCVTLEI